LPPLACLFIYRYGLDVWFTQDDYAWLGLHNQVNDLPSLLRAVFTPAEHGTFRPFSERGFFLLFRHLFDMNPVPYRLCVFFTMFADLTLLNLIVRRVTGSKLAGFLAPLFWISNGVMVTVMTWTSAYMQVLCGFVLLLSFHFFLKYVETGERRWWRWTWGPFLFGFGVMETNLVFPALVAVYAWLFARPYFKKTLPFFIPSILFTALDLLFVPKQSAGFYAMHFDFSMLRTLRSYWRLLFEPRNVLYYSRLPAWAPRVGTVVFSLALLGFAVWMTRRKRWLPLFFLAWFVIVLGPVLPLREHITVYYLTLPSIGVAALGAYAAAWAISSSSRRPMLNRAVAIGLALIFLAFQVPESMRTAKWWSIRAYRVKTLVEGVMRARELHPHEVILLAGVDDSMFWGCVGDAAFYSIGISDVYLAPGSGKLIREGPYVGLVESKSLPVGAVVNALEHDQMVVYQVGDPLVNITRRYRREIQSQDADLPHFVDAGNPLTAYLLGPTWFPDESGYRWMPQRATLRIHGPESPAQKLFVSGFCRKEQLEAGPLTMRVAMDGTPLGSSRITKGDAAFSFDYPLPAQFLGKREVEVALEVDRTFAEPKTGRQVGLVFGTIEVK
jgi:hypothetical protein